MQDFLSQFSQSMEYLGIDSQSRVAVAVSGGGDSMALALLCKHWGANVLALTVDHGLRTESAQEARKTGDILTAQGITHKILKWQGDKPDTHIQERARAARYDLLIRVCKEEDIQILALAHNAEDQMETFWMRLAAGSGLDGLSGMAPSVIRDGVRLIRPVLSWPRALLRDVCRACDVSWMEDPSNDNADFLRVRLRAFEDMLAQEGLTPQRLSHTMQKLADARTALESVAQTAYDRMTTSENDKLTMKLDQWCSSPQDIQRRLIIKALGQIKPSSYAPRHASVQDVCAALREKEFKGRTLAGCKIALRKGHIVFTPEEGT